MDKNEFKEKAKRSIDDLFDKIEELDSKKEKASEKMKAEYNENIANIKVMRADLLEKYKALEHASAENWEEKKAVFNSSMESLKEGFSKLANIFK